MVIGGECFLCTIITTFVKSFGMFEFTAVPDMTMMIIIKICFALLTTGNVGSIPNTTKL